MAVVLFAVELVVAPDDGILSGRVVRFVFETLRIGGGGGFMFGGLGGATVGLVIGALGACRMLVELIVSCD